MHHTVKSWPWFFQPMLEGKKKHDMRSKDREYSVGDTITLLEFDPRNGQYTGASLVVKITYITSNDSPCALSSAYLDNNAVILSVEKV